jgi:hypothetical protein
MKNKLLLGLMLILSVQRVKPSINAQDVLTMVAPPAITFVSVKMMVWAENKIGELNRKLRVEQDQEKRKALSKKILLLEGLTGAMGVSSIIGLIGCLCEMEILGQPLFNMMAENIEKYIRQVCKALRENCSKIISLKSQVSSYLNSSRVAFTLINIFKMFIPL